MRAVVDIFLKNGVLDSQGKAVKNALISLNYNSIKDVRVGKQIVLDMDDGDDLQSAKKDVEDMCKTFLANTVIEDYTIRFE